MSCQCCCGSCVETGSVGVIQKFGEFQGLQEPGCTCVCFPFVTVTGCSLAVNQSQCRSDCKTKDNVTVTVVTAVQYRIQKDMVKVAVFDIASPQAQIAAEVDSVLRSTLPTMTLDESYAAKEKMVEEILPSVREAMGRYGYDILNVLITDIQPERSVLDAMNEINASRRQREAAFEKGEADKLLKIKASEADAEAKRLAGVGWLQQLPPWTKLSIFLLCQGLVPALTESNQGMANMRAAMAQGFQDSMKFMKESGMSEKEAMHMMIMTQYLDTLKEFASLFANERDRFIGHFSDRPAVVSHEASSHGSIVVPHGPSAVKDLEHQIREGFLQLEVTIGRDEHGMGNIGIRLEPGFHELVQRRSAKPYTISELCLPDAVPWMFASVVYARKGDAKDCEESNLSPVEELTSTVIAALREALGGEKVNEGTNLTADSFYSSQGRADSAFNDENSQLIGEVLDRYPKAITMEMETFQLFHLARSCLPKGTMRAAACVVNVANRPTGEVVGEEALRLAESEGGKALMKAEHRVWPDSFIRYWNPKSPVALSLFVVIFKGLF
ncbi:unnamed protein product [Durusdinium trenchii]|uniref:Band 7 domain-containing protein n=1 Tax=Durusdinium trenchii TaxID=1381693 RepID=A0ABP0HZ81_9DINO